MNILISVFSQIVIKAYCTKHRITGTTNEVSLQMKQMKPKRRKIELHSTSKRQDFYYAKPIYCIAAIFKTVQKDLITVNRTILLYSVISQAGFYANKYSHRIAVSLLLRFILSHQLNFDVSLESEEGQERCTAREDVRI